MHVCQHEAADSGLMTGGGRGFLSLESLPLCKNGAGNMIEMGSSRLYSAVSSSETHLILTAKEFGVLLTHEKHEVQVL